MRPLSRVQRDESLTAANHAVRHGPEFEERRHARIHADIDEGAARTGRQKTTAGISIGHCEDPRFSKVLPESFIVGEEKHPFALDRSSESSAKLVAMKRRDRITGPVEKVFR